MSTFRCLVCDQGRGRRALRAESIHPAELWRCRACGFVQLHPLPDFDECIDSYEDASSFVEETLHIEDEVMQRDRALLEELERLGGSGPLLDVGAGAGTVVSAARNRGWAVSAIELARPSAERLRREYGIEVFERPLEELPAVEGFGVAVFSHSLEHVPSPRDALRAVLGWLRPGGLLHVAVPHWSAVKRRLAGAQMPWIYPGHLSYFTRSALERCVRDAGFEVLRLDSRPFMGRDYRYAVAVLRRFRLEPALARFLALSDGRLDALLADGVTLKCSPWRYRAVLRGVHALLAFSESGLWPKLGWGEELRLSARKI